MITLLFIMLVVELDFSLWWLLPLTIIEIISGVVSYLKTVTT